MSTFIIKPIAAAETMPVQDPFLYAVYHKDVYPAGDSKMQAPKNNLKYRMYHGDRIPGFPQHPHRGFETITCTLEGTIDHSDSLGGCGRYGNGDLQWMTAGKGILYGEMFPLLHPNKENRSRYFQLWLNLPSRKKMVKPNQVMHWSENITRFTTEDANVSVTVFAGSLLGHSALPPAKDSFAKIPGSDVNIWHITMKAGSTFTLPPSAENSMRSLYFVEGSGLTLDENTHVIPESSVVEFKDSSAKETILSNTSMKNIEVLVLQGKPIGEPVVIEGPFVMNTKEEVAQALRDYQKTRFGGWPWPEEAMVFPREKGRFLSVKGKEEEVPPSVISDAVTSIENEKEKKRRQREH
ncbi:hypothetical protein BCR33DRAFT_721148 [Rhizoclosmatium globosum]|uniref:RmlC-like cupin n=1 Tax=Rhizoclosmatium globosum TaxID=329046 RepID=A0A1Y2BTD0_9FUNG|nr:hypothetical protein BCR33DRAFT_721148 [Rhizoclosmatium globosum]|eukprot:ORY37954.1 hypothetical protein BCR33DRAFT_721148 [Rhizoclosmatium globosum]